MLPAGYVPRPVRTAASELHHRDFLTVALILDGPGPFPDNWIYVHDPEVAVGRVQNFAAWSEAMVPDPGRSCLGLEAGPPPRNCIPSSPARTKSTSLIL